MWIPAENRARLKKLCNLNNRLRWEEQYSRYKVYPYYFLSAIAAMQMNLWTEDNFSFISNRRNLFNCNLKKLINEKIIAFYSPSNVLSSSAELVQIKHFKHHAFIEMCSLVTWIWVSEDTSSFKQLKQMCKYALSLKLGVFMVLKVHSQQFLTIKSSLKTMKNAFYFTSKAFFLPKIFKFLSWLFGHVAKQLD